jgi:glucose-6-phosphate isomerase
MSASDLQAHQQRLNTLSLRRLFEDDSQRAASFSIDFSSGDDSLFLDFSKNHIDHSSFETLIALCDEKNLSEKIKHLFAGELVNNTENRPALHTTLRFQGEAKNDKENAVKDMLSQMETIVEKIHQQQWLGYTGKPITTVINIGIGGSDLGPRMVTQALSDYQQSIDVKFVANIDGSDLCDTLKNINPENTLFIIASKTFSTLETIENASSARQWMLDSGCDEKKLEQHFIAISTNLEAAKDFGISADNILPLWDWVGGRYSLWSSIGLAIAIAIGMKNFKQLLAGANTMDEHFAKTPFKKNMPVILGLLTFWYSHYWGTSTHAVLPYAQRLSRLPSYLQQLDMESLGKSVTRNGGAIDYTTGNIIWGSEGTNGQHSFHQLLHQGTLLIPVDFILIKQAMSSLKAQHKHLLACGISQSQALLKGKTLADAKKELLQQGLSEDEANRIAPHKLIEGNKPSNTLLIDKLSPKTIGSLIALYEHKVFTLSVLLDINPFDQWGVELGKQLGKPLHQALKTGEINPQWDSSTQQLIKRLKD